EGGRAGGARRRGGGASTGPPVPSQDGGPRPGLRTLPGVTAPPPTPAAKPLLRGYSHAVAAVVAGAGTIVLLARAAGDGARLISVLIYGVSLVVLFSVSALYHVGTWSPERRALLRRLDHANIFLLIAGTYTPVAVNVLRGGGRLVVLVLLWAAALAGSVALAP